MDLTTVTEVLALYGAAVAGLLVAVKAVLPLAQFLAKLAKGTATPLDDSVAGAVVSALEWLKGGLEKLGTLVAPFKRK